MTSSRSGSKSYISVIRDMASIRTRLAEKERAESDCRAHEAVGLEAFQIDVTEQKRVHDEPPASEVLFRSVFNNSLDAIVITGPDGEIMTANRSALSGPAKPGLPGLADSDLVPSTRCV